MREDFIVFGIVEILFRKLHVFGTGSNATMNKVHSGPRKRDPSHQLRPLLPLACAKPALMSDNVNHPTAYSPVFECTIDSSHVVRIWR